MRSTLAALLASCVLLESVLPALASEPAVGGPEPQAPDIQPFKSAHFGLAGTVKLDGVTIDVLGEGDIAPPDRQRSAFKFGPLTAEVIVIGDAVYTRTRFDRRWSRQFTPQSVVVGPFSSAETTRQQRDVQLVGSEPVGGVMADHYSASIDFKAVVEPLLGTVTDPTARRALETLQGSTDVWVGTQDRMIRQERIIMSLMLPPLEPDGDEASATIDLTIAYTRLNEPVSIQEPARNDSSPLRTPQPNVTPLSGPVSAPTPRQPAPGRAPVQIPGR